jgi:hypothetical protein
MTILISGSLEAITNILLFGLTFYIYSMILSCMVSLRGSMYYKVIKLFPPLHKNYLIPTSRLE